MGSARARARTQARAGQQLDTAPVDWGAFIQSLINAAIAAERQFNQAVVAEERQFTLAVLAEVIAEMRATASDDLERAVRLLTVELSDLKAKLAEVRLAVATDRTQALDLPKLPLRSGVLQ
jgi:hypothetical protein